eukprot:6468416-Amphidinium_carterae.1
MVRTRDCDKTKQAASGARTQVEKDYATELININKILKAAPHARAPCLKFLINDHFDRDVQLERPESNELEGRRKAQQKATEAKAEKKAAVEADPDGIPTMYNRLGMLPLKILLERTLPSLSPVAWSIPNLNAAYPKLKLSTEQRREELMRLLQYATGAERELPLRGPLGRWTGLLEKLKSEMVARGCREATLQLPVEWREAGVYTTVFHDDELFVVEKLTGEKMQFAVPWLHVVEMQVIREHLYVEDNFSETAAAFAMSGEFAVEPKKFGMEFQVKSKKKRPLHIMDADSPGRRLRQKTSPSKGESPESTGGTSTCAGDASSEQRTQ